MSIERTGHFVWRPLLYHVSNGERWLFIAWFIIVWRKSKDGS